MCKRKETPSTVRLSMKRDICVMAFLSLFIKEMRLCLRHERTIWLIIAYTLCIGILSWVSLTHNSNYSIPDGSGLSAVGLNLYSLLMQLQLFLLIFLTPIFTVTAVNGEKESQTFELLVCSRLSALSLISGKLIAGLACTFFLIIAAIPFFSMIFFFGGVSLAQVCTASIICLTTILFVATMSIFCSTLFQRPSISTAMTYTLLLVWLFLPLLLARIAATSNTSLLSQNSRIAYVLLKSNPLVALASTYPSAGAKQLFPLINSNFALNASDNTPNEIASFLSWNIDPWLLYSSIHLIVIALLFLLCLPLIRSRHIQR